MARSAAVAPAVRASLALAGLAWTLPFLQPSHAYPLTGFYSEWLAFALGLGAVTLLLWPRAWRPQQLPIVGLAPLGLAVLVMLQWLLGRVTYTEQALTAALYLLWTLAMMVLGSALRREIGIAAVAVVLAWSLLASGLLSAVAALLQYYQLHTLLDPLIAQRGSGGVYGNVGQQNHFADYIALALASLAYLTAAGKLRRAPAGVLAPLLLLVLALSGSRSAWLYLIALAVLGLWFHRRTPGPESRRLVICTLLLLAGFVLMQWLASLPFMIPEQGATTSARRLFEFVHGNSERLALWGEAWSAFLQSPLLGAGFGQFAWQHFLLGVDANTAAVPGLFNHAHNIMMQLLGETGLTGALIVSAGIVAWLAGLKRLDAGLHGWWLLALLAVLGLHSLLEYPLWYAHFLGIAALLSGVGATRFLAVEGRGVNRTAFAVALALGWFVAATTLQSYLELERILFTAYRNESDIPAESEFTEVLMRVHRESLLTPYVEFALAFAIVPDRERLNDKLELNARVMHFAPADTVVYRHVLLLALNGEQAAALAQLQRAAALYPDTFASFARTLKAMASRFPETFEPLLEFVSTRTGPSAER
jgi:O-antigen ligase